MQLPTSIYQQQRILPFWRRSTTAQKQTECTTPHRRIVL